VEVYSSARHWADLGYGIAPHKLRLLDVADTVGYLAEHPARDPAQDTYFYWRPVMHPRVFRTFHGVLIFEEYTPGPRTRFTRSNVVQALGLCLSS